MTQAGNAAGRTKRTPVPGRGEQPHTKKTRLKTERHTSMTLKHSMIALMAAGILAGPAWADTCSADKYTTSTTSTSSNPGTIVAVASEAGSFKTLVAAVKAAGLVDVLQGEGPFTVFAPTDEAFAKLPAGTVENLLKTENREQLKAILTYHVLPGKVMAADVKPMQAKTVNGQKVNIQVVDNKVKVDNATVVKTDVMASNGVIHVIDTVILPKAQP
jgi:uncharacterized surface protein with fasciclin (FAS1) repeats